MATVSPALQHVKSHLQALVTTEQILHIADELGHTWRQRKLNPATIIYAWLLQILAQVALEGLRHVAQIPASAAAFCKAKQRLPLQLLQKLVTLSAQTPDAAPWLWKTFTLCLVDGTSLTTPDTEELDRHFGKARNQQGTSSGYPIPKLLALFDWSTGLLTRVITLPSDRQEYTCLTRLWAVAASMGTKVLVLGDRGLVSFTHMALLLERGLHGCFRLPKGQVVRGRGRASHQRLQRLGQQDLLVAWQGRRRPKWMSQTRWQKLGLGQRTITLRQIAFRICRPGYRTHWAWIITTLLDPQAYPAQDLVELYGRRWQVEVYFRDLKQTLGMKRLRCRTLLGVQKEILMGVLLYNLLRHVMIQAAFQQGTVPNRISSIDALCWLLWTPPGTPLGRLKVNPVRVRPAPPRRLKETRAKFPQLKGRRQRLTRPPFRVTI
jgi:hypothetical protein